MYNQDKKKGKKLKKANLKSKKKKGKRSSKKNGSVVNRSIRKYKNNKK